MYLEEAGSCGFVKEEVFFIYLFASPWKGKLKGKTFLSSRLGTAWLVLYLFFYFIYLIKSFSRLLGQETWGEKWLYWQCCSRIPSGKVFFSGTMQLLHLIHFWDTWSARQLLYHKEEVLIKNLYLVSNCLLRHAGTGICIEKQKFSPNKTFCLLLEINIYFEFDFSRSNIVCVLNCFFCQCIYWTS